MTRWRAGAIAMLVAVGLIAMPATLGAQTPATIELGTNSVLSDALVAGENGLTLYIFTPDAPGVSNCNGGCAVASPPLTVPDGETPNLGAGVSGELSLITRDDGSPRLRSMAQRSTSTRKTRPPVWFYQTGGRVWFVVDASGSIVKTPSSGGTAETTAPPIAAPAGNAGLFVIAGTSNVGIAALVLATIALVLGGRSAVPQRER